MKKIGIIYKFQNKINKKIYIGQTIIIESKKELGAKIRWKQHINYAKKGSNDCPRFYNALRKYGENNFYKEILAFCDIEILDELETIYINIFDSTNKKYGYNISSGGNGNQSINEEMRKRISIGQGCDPEMMGIKKLYKNGKLIGYRAQRKEGGVRIERDFKQKSYTFKKKLELAKKFLEDIKNNKKIPRKRYGFLNNISEQKDYRDKIIGYRFKINYNNKSYMKYFTNLNESLEEKLEKAKKEKRKFKDMVYKLKTKKISVNKFNEYLNSFGKNYKKNNLPKNIKAEYKNGQIIGYRFQTYINKKAIVKSFKSKDKPLDEKLQLAIQAKEDFLNKSKN